MNHNELVEDNTRLRAENHELKQRLDGTSSPEAVGEVLPETPDPMLAEQRERIEKLEAELLDLQKELAAAKDGINKTMTDVAEAAKDTMSKMIVTLVDEPKRAEAKALMENFVASTPKQ